MKKIVILAVAVFALWITGCDENSVETNNSNNVNNTNSVNNVNNTNNINNTNNTTSVTSCDGQLCDGHGTCSLVEGFAVCSCDDCYDHLGGDPLTCYDYGCNDKPIIYLYPTKTTDVTVRFENLEDLTLSYTYPKYDDEGWRVRAEPDGTLHDLSTGMEYYSLYWEGTLNHKWHITEGTVVKGEDTVEFLEEALDKLGLTRREANEFIIYWLPRMEKNRYNLIHFSTIQWSKLVPLDITPAPDSWIRVLMVFEPLDVPVRVDPQEFRRVSRQGFTVVEWGGNEL